MWPESETLVHTPGRLAQLLFLGSTLRNLASATTQLGATERGETVSPSLAGLLTAASIHLVETRESSLHRHRIGAMLVWCVTRCPDIPSNIILGVSVQAFLAE